MINNSSVTFRIKDESIDKLRRLSAEEGISLSGLVNKVLDSYLEWEFIAPKVGFLPLWKSVLTALFDSVSEDRIKEIAVQTADSFEDEVLMMRGKIDLDSVLSLLKSRIKRSGFTLREFGNNEENDRIKFVIQHDVGEGWSVFAKTYIERLIGNLGYLAKVNSIGNSLSVEILNADRFTEYYTSPVARSSSSGTKSSKDSQARRRQ